MGLYAYLDQQLPDDGHEKTVFKEGNFKEMEKVDSEGNPTGDEKDQWMKSGWFEDDESSWKSGFNTAPEMTKPAMNSTAE